MEPKLNDDDVFDSSTENLEQFLVDIDTRFKLKPKTYSSDNVKLLAERE